MRSGLCGTSTATTLVHLSSCTLGMTSDILVTSSCVQSRQMHMRHHSCVGQLAQQLRPLCSTAPLLTLMLACL